MNDSRFCLASALAAAERDEVALWVGGFLASRGSDNEVLAAALAQRPHWWLGPVELPLERLERLAGPEDDALCQVDDDEWDDDVEAMTESLDDGWRPPPLLAEHQDGRLLLQDGNHRFEAMVRAGETHGWVLIYFASAAERDAFVTEEPSATVAPTSG